jgi:mannitol 2-dehydrogenase
VLRHALAPLLRQRALQGGPNPDALLSIEAVFSDLGTMPAFVEPLRHWLQSLYAVGIRRTLAAARAQLRF